MKRLLSILLFIPIVGFSQYTAIPDQNFESYLETHDASGQFVPIGNPSSMGDGIDNNNLVLTANISGVTYLSITTGTAGGMGGACINDLTGLEDFISLDSLFFETNYNCSVLDLSMNTGITYLSCGGLSTLDVSGCNSLTSLDCSLNVLSSLDVGQNTALTYLDCRQNTFLKSLDLSQNTALEYLNCSMNELDTIDLSQNTSLTTLVSHECEFMSLDVGQNTALTTLVCFSNDLTTLDLGNNTALTYLDCGGNQLTCLNLKNGNNSNLEDLETYDNPNLTCIEVEDADYSNTNWLNNDDFQLDNNHYFSNDCDYPADCYFSSTNIKEYQSNISIYPNPTNNPIQIEIESYNGSFQSELYNFTGKLLKTTNNTSLDLADYPRGIYFLKVAYGDRVEQLKVVKD